MRHDATEWTELSELIRRARAVGSVTVRAEPAVAGCAPRDAADALVARAGFRPLGPRWIEVDGETARQSLERLLEREIASDRAVMAASEASRLAARFVELAATATFLTNGSWSAGAVSTGAGARLGPFWSPVTQAGMDGGVIAATAARVAMVWVQDDG